VRRVKKKVGLQLAIVEIRVESVVIFEKSLLQLPLARFVQLAR
jgi:hypothetical protein